MRIAYIVAAFPHISETFVVNQIVGIAARGHTVDIYTTSDGIEHGVPSTIERYGLMERTHRLHGSSTFLIRVVKLLGLVVAYGWRAPRIVLRVLDLVRRSGPVGSVRLLYAALTFVRLRRRHYDVIHAQFGSLGMLATQVVDIKAVSGSIVTSFRGYEVGRRWKADAATYEALFRKGDLFLPVSRTLAERLLVAGCAPSKVRVHHSGIECSHLPYTERGRSRDACTEVLSVGRLVEKKGIAYAVQAVACIDASARSVHYTIVGDGPRRGELERLIDDLDLTGRVTLTGWKSHEEVLGLIDTSHILVAPSVTAANGDEEGIPNAIKEAMAMGLPVVSTRHGGIPELVEDGVSGFLVAERDVEALAERMTYLIDHPEIWAAMGRAGRGRIEAEYDVEKLNDELVEIYRSAVEQDMLEARQSSATEGVRNAFEATVAPNGREDPTRDVRLG